MNGLFALTVGQILVVSAAFGVLPLVSQRDLFFAITVGPDFRRSDAARRILRRYLVRVTAVGLAGTVLGAGFAAWLPGAAAHHAVLALLAAVTVAQVGVYTAARRAVRPHARASARREVALSAPAAAGDFLPRPRILLALPYAVIAGAAIWLVLHQSALPARVAIHFDAAGHPDHYVPRDSWWLFLPLVEAAGLVVLFNALMFVAPRVRRLGDTRNRLRIANIVLLEAMTMISLVMGYVAVLPTFVRAQDRLPVLAVGIAAIVVGAVGGMLATLVVGARRVRGAGAGRRELGDRTPDECWKLGIFYVNRADPALWVEERIGIGYTLNLAHPLAIPLVVLFVGAIALAALAPVILR